MIDPDSQDDLSRTTALLGRLHELLTRIGHPRAEEIATLARLPDDDPEQFWRRINANDLWAGAGSLAADTLMENPGLPEVQWRDTVRDFRELLADLGEALMGHGGANPGIPSWVMAFRNWNASEV